jgi:hypothetical protein
MSPILNFLVLVIIGAGIGFAMNRYGRSWLGRQVSDVAGAGDITYALVGIAGSFMGYHIGLILSIYIQFVLYLLAALGAALTVWAWRGR